VWKERLSDFLLGVTLLWLAPALHATEFYVSAAGRDSNPCS